ncbi:DNA-binding protein SMUBP-2 [Chrysoperla carnea]|uniref:DNA-binding protein SMUBP-2 n=1 Tax=Chrysoperla carnea TaxID=189513 RepID=UPI001D075542|nr:DNA-binding protein SMUBP-2 [Chrysoperla carnea]XP_044726996.1 DNA-binding protein SMUBP-2 [Chrysoperla carnea]
MSSSKNPPDFVLIPPPSASANSKKKKKNKTSDDSSEPSASNSKSTITSAAKRLQKDTAKDIENLLKQVNIDEDIDKTLNMVQEIDQTCGALKCKVKVKDFAITCDYCKKRYCTQHYLPEVHGCDIQVKNDYRKRYLNQVPEKVPQHKKDQTVSKFHRKLKEMENSRKKQPSGKSNTKK